MKKLIILVLLSIGVNSFAQSKHFIVMLEKIKVKMPAQPSETIQGAYRLNTVIVPDSTVNLKALEINLIGGGMNKQDALRLKNSDSFWAETRQQILSQFNNPKILSEKYLNYKDEKVLEIIFERADKKGRKGTVTFWLFIRDEFAYQLFFFDRGNKASGDLKKDFFDVELIN